jgi:hypothetical protein
MLPMQQSKTPKGGAREGAGRPPATDPKQTHGIRTTGKQWETFQAQGGNKWLCALLDSLANVVKSVSKKP